MLVAIVNGRPELPEAFGSSSDAPVFELLGSLDGVAPGEPGVVPGVVFPEVDEPGVVPGVVPGVDEPEVVPEGVVRVGVLGAVGFRLGVVRSLERCSGGAVRCARFG